MVPIPEMMCNAGLFSEIAPALGRVLACDWLVQMVYDAELLEQGLCDVLPSKEMSKEELDAACGLAGGDAAAPDRRCRRPRPTEMLLRYDLVIDDKIKTNGGWMYDIYITKDDKENPW